MKIQIQLGPDRSRLHPMTRLRMERNKTYTVKVTPDIHRAIASGDFVRIEDTANPDDPAPATAGISAGGE